MANDKTPDPSRQFSEWVTQWERAFDEYSNRLMGTEEFSKGMNQFQNMQMEFQKNFNRAMAQQLANFNIPSRDEVLKISEALATVDRRLSRMEKALDKLAGGAPATPAKKKSPARTRKPPSKGKKET